jgi:hypothetical protein
VRPGDLAEPAGHRRIAWREQQLRGALVACGELVLVDQPGRERKHRQSALFTRKDKPPGSPFRRLRDAAARLPVSTARAAAMLCDAP